VTVWALDGPTFAGLITGIDDMRAQEAKEAEADDG
jgi:hypothetical protein